MSDRDYNTCSNLSELLPETAHIFSCSKNYTSILEKLSNSSSVMEEVAKTYCSKDRQVLSKLRLLSGLRLL